MKTYHIPIFVPHKGCPHDCVFCNQRHITGQVTDTTPRDVVEIVENNLSTISGDTHIQVAFFGGSFTAIDTHMQTALLQAAYPYVRDGRVQGIRCSTRPDAIDDEILDNFIKYGGCAIELGVQSAHEEVLRLSRRGHSFEDVKKASALIKNRGIELGLQMMLGLPGDTPERMRETAERLIELGPSCVRIYPTLVVEDTALHTMYQRGLYTPLTVDEAVEALSVVIPMFERAGTDIIRVGLQTTDDINETTVTGPYHPAIRELAEGRIIRKVIEANMCPENGVLTVCCPGRLVSRVAGHNRCNREYFRDKYNADIRILQDDSLSGNELKICDKIVAIY